MSTENKIGRIFSKGLELSTAPESTMSDFIKKLDEEVEKSGFSLAAIREDRLDPAKHTAKLKSV